MSMGVPPPGGMAGTAVQAPLGGMAPLRDGVGETGEGFVEGTGVGGSVGETVGDSEVGETGVGFVEVTAVDFVGETAAGFVEGTGEGFEEETGEGFAGEIGEGFGEEIGEGFAGETVGDSVGVLLVDEADRLRHQCKIRRPRNWIRIRIKCRKLGAFFIFFESVNKSTFSKQCLPFS